MIDETREAIERGFFLLAVAVISFILGIFIGIEIQKSTNTSHPVEETIVKVDSLININDTIKLKVEQLDSIKDAKIIEVQTLDNDSTLKLFYELISE